MVVDDRRLGYAVHELESPLAPGEARTLTLEVPVRRLGFHLDDGTYVVEPGEFQVFVGGHSDAALRRAARSRGNVRGSGKPPANEITSGRVVIDIMSRIAEDFMTRVREANSPA